jgi:hypothetical protein
MPVTVVCPSCKAKLKAPDNLVGKAVKCPGCGSAVLVKAVAAVTPAGSGSSPKAPALAKPKTAPPPPKKPQPFEDLDEVDEVEDIEDYEDEPAPSVAKGKAKKAAPPAEEGDRGPVSDNDKTMGLLLHLSSLVVGIIGPVVLWIMKRKESPFIDHHGKQHLNFAATLFCVAMVLIILGGGVTTGLFFVHYIAGLIGGGLVGLVFLAFAFYGPIMIIIAALKAKAGVWYRFPMTIKLFK